MQLVVPPELGYPADDPSHERVGPKPTTFGGQRTLDFVLQNKNYIDKVSGEGRGRAGGGRERGEVRGREDYESEQAPLSMGPLAASGSSRQAASGEGWGWWGLTWLGGVVVGVAAADGDGAVRRC